MKAIPKEELIDELKKSLLDYCLLLPIIERNEAIETLECYVSSSSKENFICYIRYSDGIETIDVNWNQKETEEALELIKRLKNKGYFSKGCFVALYKNERLMNDLTVDYELDNIEYIESYYSIKDISLKIKEGIGEFVETTECELDNEFINQSGNHIKIIERDLKLDPEDNKIIYMVVKEKIIGYIALKRQYEKIWDVAYIFVDERYRNRGYATLLCYNACLTLYEANEILYYSYCENEASRAVAKKSGLIPCAKRYVFRLFDKNSST